MIIEQLSSLQSPLWSDTAAPEGNAVVHFSIYTMQRSSGLLAPPPWLCLTHVCPLPITFSHSWSAYLPWMHPTSGRCQPHVKFPQSVPSTIKVFFGRQQREVHVCPCNGNGASKTSFPHLTPGSTPASKTPPSNHNMRFRSCDLISHAHHWGEAHLI